MLLYFFVRYFKPKVVLETGVAAGFSSLSILKALKKKINMVNFTAVTFLILELKIPKIILEF